MINGLASAPPASDCSIGVSISKKFLLSSHFLIKLIHLALVLNTFLEWGYPPRRAADLRVVDVYVARLRGKLEPDPRNPELILTVRGIGYASQRVGETATSLAS